MRCPSHPAAQAVLRAAQALGVRGVAAPSANRFGRVSPTTAAHVQQEFAHLCVLDGGACDVGIESTIVDCTRGVPVLLRPGVLTPEQLTQACGVAVLDPRNPPHATAEEALATPAPRASGTLESHYAPQARVRLMTAHTIDEALKSSGVAPMALWSRQQPGALPAHVQWQAMPSDPQRCAHELFAVLRAFDAQGVAEIWVEHPPQGAAWDGVRDRLTRAAVPAAPEAAR